MTREFPTRQVLDRHLEQRSSFRSMLLRAARVVTFQTASSQSISASENLGSPDSPLFAMVLGLDALPRRMKVAEVADFEDPFTTQLLLKGVVPLTLEDLSAAIDQLAGDEARPLRKLYVVAEGAAFQASNPKLEINARLVITWQKDNQTAPDLMLSSVSALNDPRALMQLISWSETQGVYHFFERKSGAWAWAGNSLHALDPATRGKGPFDSHINGGLVMKELKFPWVHWHSQASTIAREVVLPVETERNHPLFAHFEGAEVLEAAVVAGVRRWTKRRILRDVTNGRLGNLPQYARHLVWATSVNLVASRLLSRRLESVPEIFLPRTFFFDEDGLRSVIEEFTDRDVMPPQDFVVPSELYRAALHDLKVRVSDGIQSVPGDTEFAFVVPERAFEDQIVVKELMARGVLSPRLALCLHLIDFANPIFSPERASLLGLFPADIEVGDEGATLDKAILDAAQAAPASASAAKELIALFNDAQLIETTQARLGAFSKALQARLRTADGVVDVLRLADSRREAFRRRKLHEFKHTTAVTDKTEPHLAMRPDATVFLKTSRLGEEEQ